MAWKTLSVRRQEELTRRKLAVQSILDDLRKYAKRNGGRFIVFGSFIKGNPTFQSDLDLIVDFHDNEGKAYRFAEDACAKHGIPCDLRELRYCSDDLINEIRDYKQVVS